MARQIFTILAINPGSTSTKLAVFRNSREVASKSISHPVDEIGKFKRVTDQTDMRYTHVLSFISEVGILHKLSSVVGRGGLMRPIPSGVYNVNNAMLEDLSSGKYGEHASNLGAIIAQRVATAANIRAYIVDPVVVDEMDDVARITGHPDIQRMSRFHALNHKSSARAAASKLGKPYEECNLIVAHLGGGISVGAHKKGRVVDVNNALYGDGPFSPERCGTLPIGDLVKLCLSGDKTEAEIKKALAGRGGVVAHLGANDLRIVEEKIKNGDAKAKLVLDALIYQVAQEIAKHGATLSGDVDAIVITGGIAYDKGFVKTLSTRIKFLARVIVIPGEREMISLATNVLAVLRGEREPMEY